MPSFFKARNSNERTLPRVQVRPKAKPKKTPLERLEAQVRRGFSRAVCARAIERREGTPYINILAGLEEKDPEMEKKVRIMRDTLTSEWFERSLVRKQ